MEDNSCAFLTDENSNCHCNILQNEPLIDNTKILNEPTSQMKHKHKYRNTFGKANINYHKFDNNDTLTYTDSYALITARTTKPLLVPTGSNNNTNLSYVQ